MTSQPAAPAEPSFLSEIVSLNISITFYLVWGRGCMWGRGSVSAHSASTSIAAGQLSRVSSLLPPSGSQGPAETPSLTSHLGGPSVPSCPVFFPTVKQ